MKDDAGHTFGAFVPFPWKNAKGFYGTGECFVFKLAPTFKVRAPHTPLPSEEGTSSNISRTFDSNSRPEDCLVCAVSLKNAKGFYGTGECFVFKLAPTFQVRAPST